jgi:hypothetical protein
LYSSGNILIVAEVGAVKLFRSDPSSQSCPESFIPSLAVLEHADGVWIELAHDGFGFLDDFTSLEDFSFFSVLHQEVNKPDLHLRELALAMPIGSLQLLRFEPPTNVLRMDAIFLRHRPDDT